MSVGLGCQNCEFLDLCGGVFDSFDCLSYCCNKPDECTLACPRSPGFVTVVQDAGGLDSARHWNILQTGNNLPAYIPHIHNGSTRTGSLPSQYVALTTFDVVSSHDEPIFSDRDDLRQHFRISRDAHILLLSIGKDNLLEHYWQWSVARKFAQNLTALGISHVTAPNFSFPLDVPRPEHLVNRMRSLRCAEQLSAAGLSVIPHVNAYNQKDWNCWRDFLRDHAHISIIAQEFQTGLASRNRAKWHIEQLSEIQQALGRGLHLLAVGGRRHLSLLTRLSGISVVDSVPFMRACKRRLLERETGNWVVKLTEPGEPIDELLYRNVRAYTHAVENIIATLQQADLRVPEAALEATYGQAALHDVSPAISDGQLWLWPQKRTDSNCLAAPTA